MTAATPTTHAPKATANATTRAPAAHRPAGAPGAAAADFASLLAGEMEGGSPPPAAMATPTPATPADPAQATPSATQPAAPATPDPAAAAAAPQPVARAAPPATDLAGTGDAAAADPAAALAASAGAWDERAVQADGSGEPNTPPRGQPPAQGRLPADASEQLEPIHTPGPPMDAASDAAAEAAAEAAGALALQGAPWQAVSEVAPAFVPITPSAEGALPSLVAPADTTALAPSAEPAMPAAHQAHLPQTPGSEAFTAALGQQLRTWLQSGVAHARLSLNPADLGPIDVRIAVAGGQAQVDLLAGVAATREALAQALPLLTAQLEGADLALASGLGTGSWQGGRESRQEGSPYQNATASADASRAGEAGHAQGLAALGRPPAAGRGLVDLYA